MKIKRSVRRLAAAAVLSIAALVAVVPRAAHASTAPITARWSTQAVVTVTLTPNYFAGYGQVKAGFGTQPTPTHGPNATGVGLGDIDFGSVLSGADYLYKYAAHLKVTTNDSSGFVMYAEGAADFLNQADASTAPIASTLFYVPSTSGTPADPNNGFTPGLPFQRTNAFVAGGSYGVAPTINYGGSYPGPIATSLLPTADYYYDYLLKVPAMATGGNYFVWVVYTVVPS